MCLSFSYLNAVLDETLRLSRTGVFSSRVSRQEMMVGGHLIPANTPFINSIGTISMDEKYYPQSER